MIEAAVLTNGTRPRICAQAVKSTHQCVGTVAFRFRCQPEDDDSAQQAADCRHGEHGPPVSGQLRHGRCVRFRRAEDNNPRSSQRKLLERHQQIEECYCPQPRDDSHQRTVDNQSPRRLGIKNQAKVVLDSLKNGGDHRRGWPFRCWRDWQSSPGKKLDPPVRSFNRARFVFYSIGRSVGNAR